MPDKNPGKTSRFTDGLFESFPRPTELYVEVVDPLLGVT